MAGLADFTAKEITAQLSGAKQTSEHLCGVHVFVLRCQSVTVRSSQAPLLLISQLPPPLTPTPTPSSRCLLQLPQAFFRPRCSDPFRLLTQTTGARRRSASKEKSPGEGRVWGSPPQTQTPSACYSNTSFPFYSVTLALLICFNLPEIRGSR